MAGGLRYETGRDMPPGMIEKAAVKIARDMEQGATCPTSVTAGAVPPSPSGEGLGERVATPAEQARNDSNKEKLIKLLCKATFGVNKQTTESYLIPSAIAEVADYLIANGVEIRECIADCKNCWKTKLVNAPRRWIPVSERLPDNKEHDWVLAQVVEDNGFMHIPKVMEYRQQRNDWFEETYGWLSEHNGAFIVTHWMPLPEPPEVEK